MLLFHIPIFLRGISPVPKFFLRAGAPYYAAVLSPSVRVCVHVPKKYGPIAPCSDWSVKFPDTAHTYHTNPLATPPPMGHVVFCAHGLPAFHGVGTGPFRPPRPVSPAGGPAPLFWVSPLRGGFKGGIHPPFNCPPQSDISSPFTLYGYRPTLITSLVYYSVYEGAHNNRRSVVGGSIPGRAKFVQINFSPFNLGDCVSLVARMTT